MYFLNPNEVVTSKATGRAVKILAVVKSGSVSRENLVAVCETRRDVLGRVYAKPETTKLVKQGSIERRYN